MKDGIPLVTPLDVSLCSTYSRCFSSDSFMGIGFNNVLQRPINNIEHQHIKKFFDLSSFQYQELNTVSDFQKYDRARTWLKSHPQLWWIDQKKEVSDFLAKLKEIPNPDDQIQSVLKYAEMMQQRLPQIQINLGLGVCKDYNDRVRYLLILLPGAIPRERFSETMSIISLIYDEVYNTD